MRLMNFDISKELNQINSKITKMNVMEKDGKLPKKVTFAHLRKETSTPSHMTRIPSQQMTRTPSVP